MAASPKMIQRKIHFFRLHVPPNPDGSKVDFDVRAALQAINTLTFTQKAGTPRSRYADTKVGMMCAWPHITNKASRIELGRIRNNDLPMLLQKGSRSELPIEPGDSLVEPTHLQFFDEGIVGAEFNYYGPRATSFYSYCENRIPNTPFFRLQHLLRNDVADHLDRFDDLHLITIRVHPNQSKVLSKFGISAVQDLRASKEQNRIGTIAVTLKSEPRQPLPSRLLREVKKAFRDMDSPHETFDTFKVKGRTDTHHQIEELNLLSDRFVEVARVPTDVGRSRRVISSKMYEAIESAYNERKVELEKAASVDMP